ncbi:MAG TPA: hypothetical protein VF334_22650 [Polyangia bacterium]
MRWSWSLVALAAVAVGCNPNDCAQSADIQVTVAPNGDVTVGDIARLHVMLSVADGPVRVLDINHSISMSGSAFILRPDPAPADKYDVSMTVQAFDELNDLIAIGSESMQAVTKGCNRLTVHLAALPLSAPVDMAIPPGGPFDLAGVVPPDLAGCIGGTPDEDSDGRANICDLCPADADPSPVDTDGDGLPDACDPDPAMKTNTLVYFEPFDTTSGHWSGTNQITQSYMNIDTNGVGGATSTNATDMLPLNVRVQTEDFPKSVYGTNGGDSGIFVGTSPNPNMGSGVFCALTANGGPDTLDIYRVTNGSYSVPTSQSLGAPLMMANYRLRLTHRAGAWTCEALLSGGTPVTVTTSQTVTAPLFITLMNDNMGSHFHNVVAETKL